MASTRMTRLIRAPRAPIYAALTSADAIARWKFPDDMSIEIHEFDGREGGAFRISLTYDAPERAGKSSGHTDTYRGSFVQLVPDEKVVEVDEFETADAALGAPMTITVTLAHADGGTEVTALHEGLPDDVPVADNETGWRMALEKLAGLVEG